MIAATALRGAGSYILRRCLWAAHRASTNAFASTPSGVFGTIMDSPFSSGKSKLSRSHTPNLQEAILREELRLRCR